MSRLAEKKWHLHRWARTANEVEHASLNRLSPSKANLHIAVTFVESAKNASGASEMGDALREALSEGWV